MKILVVGAGVTGGFTSARLHEKGADVSLLARGGKADRMERDGLRLRDGLTGEERTVRLPIVRAPVMERFELVMVCVQEQHRFTVDDLLHSLPGRPILWYLGNTSVGFERLGEAFGRERVLGGFPGVGGTWDDAVLVYADREKATDAPLDRLIVGEAFESGAPSAQQVVQEIGGLGMRVERYTPIMAWHWSHLALVLPLACATYAHDGSPARVAQDPELLKRTMRCTSAAFHVVSASGFPILPKGLRIMRFLPAWLGAWKLRKLFASDFGRIAIAGHAATAREEMRALAKGFLEAGGEDVEPELRGFLEGI